MRKRKPPYVLATVLVVLLGLVFIVNGGLNRLLADDGTTHVQEEPPATGESRATGSVESLASATKAVAGGVEAPSKPKGQHLPDASPPSIEVQAGVPQKPVPNETMTNSQWYREPEQAPKKGK